MSIFITGICRVYMMVDVKILFPIDYVAWYYYTMYVKCHQIVISLDLMEIIRDDKDGSIHSRQT